MGVTVIVFRTASREQYVSSSSPTGRSREFRRWAKALLTLLDKCTRPRNSSVRTGPLPYTAGRTGCLPCCWWDENAEYRLPRNLSVLWTRFPRYRDSGNSLPYSIPSTWQLVEIDKTLRCLAKNWKESTTTTTNLFPVDKYNQWNKLNTNKEYW